MFCQTHRSTEADFTQITHVFSSAAGKTKLTDVIDTCGKHTSNPSLAVLFLRSFLSIDMLRSWPNQFCFWFVNKTDISPFSLLPSLPSVLCMLAGQHEGYPACKMLGADMLVMMIWLEPYSSSKVVATNSFIHSCNKIQNG